MPWARWANSVTSEAAELPQNLPMLPWLSRLLQIDVQQNLNICDLKEGQGIFSEHVMGQNTDVKKEAPSVECQPQEKQSHESPDSDQTQISPEQLEKQIKMTLGLPAPASNK